MSELVSEHALLGVELAYLFHTTFSVSLLLYPSVDNLTGACVRTALKLIDII